MIHKMGNSYWRIGKGILGYVVEEYKVINVGEEFIKLEKMPPDSQDIRVFKSLEEAREYLKEIEK